MLSHQQLLYLLTMSFVSRVPRSLLPGGRSSRLRDRQKEERELSVKKAFIEDMLNENNLLSILLGRESIYHAVLWDPDLLPSLRKETQLPCLSSTVSTTPIENVSDIHSENDKSSNLLDEMSLYMETLNDLYMDDDDISCDFQVDSGTLACVACGILGFPFMSLVHPSEKTSMELLPADHLLVQQGQGVSKTVNCHSSPVHDGSIKGSVSDNLPPLHGISLPPKESITKIDVGWNASSGFLRPRIFCLKHAVQTEEMLRSKGGANVLVICHSDYQKIKAHAVVIAEEINSPFNYIEIPLDNASQEDLNLIDLAIDDEHHDECGEEWTSKLGINLRHSVKVRKNSPAMQVQHALTLGGFSDESLSFSSDFFNINWQARRSRSKIKSNNPARHNPCEILQKNDKMFGRGLDGVIVKKEEKILQYSRRNFKSKPCGSSSGHGLPRKHLPAEVSGDIFGDLDKHGREESENNLCNDGNTENSSAVTDLSASIRMSEMQHEILVLEVTRGMRLSSFPAQVAESLVSASSVCGHVKVEVKNQTSEELATSGCFKREHKIRVTEITSEKNEMPCAEGSDSPLSPARTESFEMQKDNQIMEKINIMNGACNLVTQDHPKGCRDVQADGDVSMNELPDLDVHTSWSVSVPLMGSFDAKLENAGVEKFLEDPEGCLDVQADGDVSMNELPDLDVRTCLAVAEPLVETFDAEMENADVEKVRINSENCDCVAIDNEVQERIQTTERSNEKEPASSNAKLINRPTASVQESCGDTRETCASENTCIDLSLANEIQQDMKSKNESNEDESISSKTEIINQPTAIIDENSEVPKEHSAAADLCNDVIIYNEVQLKIQSSNNSIEEKPVSSNVTLINQPPASVIESSESPRETSAAVDFCKGKSLDDGVDLGMKRTNVNNEEESVSSYVTPMNPHTPASTEVNQPTLVSVEECSEVPGGTCAEEILCSGLTSDTALQLEIQTANETNKEETVSNFVMQKEAIQPVSVLLGESLEIPREVCAKDNPGGGVILDDEVQLKNQSTGGSTEEGPSFSCGAVIYEPTLASIQESSEIQRETQAAEDNKELEVIKATAVEPSSSAEKGGKRKREMEQKTESIFNCNGFIRSPCEGLRPRAGKDTGHRSSIDISNTVEENPVKKRLRKPSEVSNPRKEKKENTNGSHIHRCDLEGCRMSLKSKAELLLHKRNRCPVPECKKRFSSHKYAVLHQRVHDDERPLKCPWKGCSMTFKWAWARTEHIRVHTGERPYQCKVENCGLSFRFVSDFSRHRRKTGHYVNSKT